MTPAPRRVSGPLAGVRVIEFASYVAVPMAGMTLAQLGARVMKVEPIGGGADRDRMPIAASGASVYWTSLNKAKSVVRIDLTQVEGVRLASQLIVGEPGPTVVLTNGRLPRELGYEELAARRPDLVYVSLTGRRDASTAVDYTVQASTGLPYLGGTGPGESALNALPAWDVIASGHIATAVVAALLHRSVTGQGTSVSIALEDVALATLGNLGHLVEAQLGLPPRPQLGNHVFGLLAHDFDTVDGQKVMLVILTQRHWRELKKLVGLEAVFAALEEQLGVDFDEAADRYAHRETLVVLIATWFGARNWSEVNRALAKSHLVWSDYRELADLVAGPHAVLTTNPLFEPVEQEGIGSVRVPGPPMVWNGNRLSAGVAMTYPCTAETLGEELGLTKVEVDELARLGVIG